MKALGQWMTPAIMICGALMALPMVGLADKGGNPNAKSEAVTAACIVDEGSVHVYSCKGLSNVVLWCGETWVKHDDIGEEGEEVYDGVFDCGTDAEGEPISGPITMVAVKSGSLKNTTVEGAPRGSGLFLSQLPSCSDESFEFPLPGECDVPEDPEPPLN